MAQAGEQPGNAAGCVGRLHLPLASMPSPRTATSSNAMGSNVPGGTAWQQPMQPHTSGTNKPGSALGLSPSELRAKLGSAGGKTQSPAALSRSAMSVIVPPTASVPSTNAAIALWVNSSSQSASARGNVPGTNVSLASHVQFSGLTKAEASISNASAQTFTLSKPPAGAHAVGLKKRTSITGSVSSAANPAGSLRLAMSVSKAMSGFRRRSGSLTGEHLRGSTDATNTQRPSPGSAVQGLDMVQLARIRRMLDEFSDDSEGDDEFYAELANEAGCDRPPTQRDSPRGVGDRSLSMSNSMGGGASSMAHWQPAPASSTKGSVEDHARRLHERTEVQTTLRKWSEAVLASCTGQHEVHADAEQMDLGDEGGGAKPEPTGLGAEMRAHFQAAVQEEVEKKYEGIRAGWEHEVKAQLDEARETSAAYKELRKAHAETKDALNKAYSRMEMLRRQVKGAAGTELESASQRGTEDGAVTIDEATEEGPSQPAAAAAEGQLQGSSAAGSRAGSRPESRMSLRASASGEDYGDGGRKPAGPRAEEVAALQQQLQDQKQANNALSSRLNWLEKELANAKQATADALAGASAAENTDAPASSAAAATSSLVKGKKGAGASGAGSKTSKGGKADAGSSSKALSEAEARACTLEKELERVRGESGKAAVEVDKLTRALKEKGAEVDKVSKELSEACVAMAKAKAKATAAPVGPSPGEIKASAHAAVLEAQLQQAQAALESLRGECDEQLASAESALSTLRADAAVTAQQLEEARAAAAAAAAAQRAAEEALAAATAAAGSSAAADSSIVGEDVQPQQSQAEAGSTSQSSRGAAADGDAGPVLASGMHDGSSMVDAILHGLEEQLPQALSTVLMSTASTPRVIGVTPDDAQPAADQAQSAVDDQLSTPATYTLEGPRLADVNDADICAAAANAVATVLQHVRAQVAQYISEKKAAAAAAAVAKLHESNGLPSARDLANNVGNNNAQQGQSGSSVIARSNASPRRGISRIGSMSVAHAVDAVGEGVRPSGSGGGMGSGIGSPRGHGTEEDSFVQEDEDASGGGAAFDAFVPPPQQLGQGTASAWRHPTSALRLSQPAYANSAAVGSSSASSSMPPHPHVPSLNLSSMRGMSKGAASASGLDGGLLPVSKDLACLAMAEEAAQQQMQNGDTYSLVQQPSDAELAAAGAIIVNGVAYLPLDSAAMDPLQMRHAAQDAQEEYEEQDHQQPMLQQPWRTRDRAMASRTGRLRIRHSADGTHASHVQMVTVALPPPPTNLLNLSSVRRRQAAFAALHSTYLETSSGSATAQAASVGQGEGATPQGGQGSSNTRLAHGSGGLQHRGSASGTSDVSRGAPAGTRRAVTPRGVQLQNAFKRPAAESTKSPDYVSEPLLTINRRAVLPLGMAPGAAGGGSSSHTAMAVTAQGYDEGEVGSPSAGVRKLQRPQSMLAKAYEVAHAPSKAAALQGQARPIRSATTAGARGSWGINAATVPSTTFMVGPALPDGAHTMLEVRSSPREARGAGGTSSTTSPPHQQRTAVDSTSPPRGVSVLASSGAKVRTITASPQKGFQLNAAPRPASGRTTGYTGDPGHRTPWEPDSTPQSVVTGNTQHGMGLSPPLTQLQLHMGRDAAIASMLLPGYMQQGEMHDLPTGVHELQTMVRELAASQAAAAAEAGRLAGLRAELAAEVTASRVAWHAEAAHRVALEAQLRGHGH